MFSDGDNKFCPKCRTEKPKSGFSKSKKDKDGLCCLCKVCISKIRKAREKTPKGEKARRNLSLRYLYGITLKDYDELLESQGGVCAICGTDTPCGVGRFHVDHNHATGKVRGVLCHRCNLALGFSGENISILQSAIEYLVKWEAKVA